GDSTTRSITVTITDDDEIESLETLEFALSAPTGGVAIGSPSTHQLQISDNDVPVNDPPIVDAGPDASGDEGIAIDLTGSVTDPDSPGVSAAWSFTAGPGTDFGADCSFDDGTSPTTTVTCTDDGE